MKFRSSYAQRIWDRLTERRAKIEVDPEYVGRTHADEKGRIVAPDPSTIARRAANSSAMEELRKRALGAVPELAAELEAHPHSYDSHLSKEEQRALFRDRARSRRNSMAVQVGGDHYRKTVMQPFEFTLANGWDGAAHTILKYIARCEDKGGAQDLEKALHVTLIRADHLPRDIDAAKPRPWANPISIDVYCAVNGYEGHKRLALLALARWVDQPGNDWNRMKVESAIQDYLAVAYPVPGL